MFMFSIPELFQVLLAAILFVRLSDTKEITFGGFRITFGGNSKLPKQLEK